MARTSRLHQIVSEMNNPIDSYSEIPPEEIAKYEEQIKLLILDIGEQAAADMDVLRQLVEAL